MRAPLRPRLASLEVFATTLLVSLGCSSNVQTEGGGGSGGIGNKGGGGSTADFGGIGSSSGGSTGDLGGSTLDIMGPGGSSAQGGATFSGGCIDPQPILVDGQDTGLDQCAGGQLRRRAAVQCPSSFPDPNTCCGTCPDGQICSTQGEIACSCVPDCFNDSDCQPGELCMCGDPAGICVPAGCTGPQDCDPGQECTSWDPTEGCLYLEFQCTTEADSCGGNNDCPNPPNTFCVVEADGHRDCQAGGCAIGRPFLVEGAARTAALCRRIDWQDPRRATPAHDGGPLRHELGDAWEQIAKMEHASVGAFARFALQLLSLGAPPDLIERTTRAMADETKHAKMAFSLASFYRAHAVGPASLPIDGALDGAADAATVIALVVREGCVGETVAALEAGEAHAHARDPHVREVLDTIAEDESEHAELAWRTVRWALGAFGDEVRSAIQAEIAVLEAELHEPPAARDPLHEAALLAHGVVTDDARSRLRRSALRRAVLPCLRALLAEPTLAAA